MRLHFFITYRHFLSPIAVYLQLTPATRDVNRVITLPYLPHGGRGRPLA